MNSFRLFSLFIFSVIFSISSCKKEEGCMDPTSCNYNDLAVVDDGSCDFSCYGCIDQTAINYEPLMSIDDGSCIYAYNIALGVWDITPDCDEIDVLGQVISLNDQLPESIEVQGQGDNQLFIDIDGTQISGNISNDGSIIVPEQTVQVDFGLGFPLDLDVEGTGQVSIDDTGSMNLIYSFEIPFAGTQVITCDIVLQKQ